MLNMPHFIELYRHVAARERFKRQMSLLGESKKDTDNLSKKITKHARNSIECYKVMVQMKSKGRLKIEDLDHISEYYPLRFEIWSGLISKILFYGHVDWEKVKSFILESD